MAKMTNNKKIKFGMFLLIGILLIVSISAYSRSTTQYIPPTSSSNYLNKQGISLTQSFSEDTCQAGQDFVVQISPLGCTPTVVRSDLLEEQNVPVFCQLAATKINPLIYVEAIESISFKGDYPREVSGVGFYPANAGIKTSQSTLLNSPILNNIGYAVIVLRKQPNESAMPDWVEGNMTAKIKYDVKNAFGIGKATYYLPQMSDEDWNLKYKQYGFWKGKGFLKADYIDVDSASVSIYRDQNNKLTSVSLTKGKTSGKINVPGFYCLASLQLRLDGLVVPDTRAKFEIDGEVVEVIKGEKFLDNKCSVRSVDKKGLYQKVKVYCRTDAGGKDVELKIAPKIRLDVDGTEGNYELGQRVKDNIYVGYIGAKKVVGNKVVDTTDKEDLILYYYYGSEDNLGNKLSESKLASINRKVESELSKVENFGELNPILIGKDDLIQVKQSDIFNFIGFAEPQDVGFTDKTLENLDELRGFEDDKVADLEKDWLKSNYENAIETYDEIIDSYSGLKFDEDEKLKDVSYGEAALYEKIELAYEVGQKASAAGFCEKFKERYPESNYLNKVGEICDEYALANSESMGWDVLINGFAKSIRFKGVYEPSEEEYSAEVSIGGEDYVLIKNEIIELNDDSSVQLISLGDDYANVKINGTRKLNLKEDVLENFGNTNIVLTKINLKKQAKVSVIPSIDNVGTEADFTFKINIEKRAIQLSPEKTMEKIKKLNETIEKWEKISEDLGDVVRGMKAACLGTSAYVTVKNFFSGFSGKAAARHDVTGWYRDKCKSEGVKGTKEMQACLLKYNDVINTDIESFAESNVYRNKISDELSYKDGKLENKEKYLSSIDEKYRELLEEENYRSDLRDILYYEDMKSKKGIFADKADKKLNEIWDRLDDDYDRKSLGQNSIKEWSDSGLERMSIQTAIFEDQRPIAYKDAVTPSDGWEKIGGSKPVQGIIHKDNNVYILELASAGDGRYRIVDVYDEDGNKIPDSNLVREIRNSYSVKKFDKTSYNNPYDAPKVIYYEIGADKGRPAIVPVDIDKGFYAATTSGLRSMDSYDSSGMPSYFFLCNVMENGKQEFNSGKDECVGVRVGSNKADGELTGLGIEKTNNWARKAISAMRSASRQYGAGVSQISIDGKKIPVGNPAVNLPGTQCEDFMSPEDCALLFNVCDPVVCPESRCDFGGKYRVSNVIQSGILGSALLCLPNFGSPAEGGVVIPVCLTGIHAGVDSLLSIYKNYGDCLQHSLDTGETVAICDEIHSIYLCEFFWKQAIPFMNLAIPKTIEFFLSGGRGGGEYLVQESWANAGKSVDYMTNYYGANAFAAFKVRATDEVGSAVCKNFISARYPSSGDFFDALIEPDSPSQFHGWFHETTFTTATVPPTSQYKVFYHIYAGKDAGVYYSVYLKSPVGSSFYADAPRRDVASGYIERGGYASETKDFLEVSGYQELCINVQGQEECGFKEVSTSFALDYLNDEYVKDQVERTDIKSEKECISGSASLYSMATPNVQAGVESVIEPKIYDQGIVRVCATSNPGEATDQTRWVDVGTCGGNLKCWLDKDSVGDAVEFDSSLEGLKEMREDALEKLKREGDYLSAALFEELVKEIGGMSDNQEKIDKVNDNIGKVLLNKEKAQLLFLKAKAYAGLVLEKILEKGVESVKPGAVVEEKEVEEEEPIFDLNCKNAQGVEVEEPREIQKIVKEASDKFGVEVDEIRAVICIESAWNSEAENENSIGLMQLEEITVKDLTEEGACKSLSPGLEYDDWKKDSRQNIFLGTAYLKCLKETHGFNDLGLRIAAYNWGPTATKKACGAGGTVEGCGTLPNVVKTHVDKFWKAYNEDYGHGEAAAEEEEEKTCSDCDKIIGDCNWECVEEAGLSCEEVEIKWWSDQCVEKEEVEPIDCMNRSNWEETTKETLGFAVDNGLKIFRTKDYEGRCGDLDVKSGETEETGYYLKKTGDIYLIRKSINFWFDKNVGVIEKSGSIRGIGEEEEISELNKYVFDKVEKVFELDQIVTDQVQD